MPYISIKKISVLQSRIVVNVSCRDKVRYSSPQLSKNVLSVYPNIKYHKCKNSNGKSFYDVIESTSIPHLLEHLIIDSQISQLQDITKKIDLFGFSQWIDESCGLAKIEITYYDDLVALCAIKSSVEFLNETFAKFI